VYSATYGFLFVHIPRTGGNSIQQVIRHFSEDRIVTDPYPDGQFRDGINRFEVAGTYTRRKHDSLACYYKAMPADEFDRAFKFCAVRDPWNRSMSFYFSPRRWLKKGVEPYWSKDEFVASLNDLRPMVDYLKIAGEIQELNFAVRFERLAADFAKVLELIGMPADAYPLPHVNKGHGRDYRQHFDQDRALVDLVGERYSEDVDHFGYAFRD
jgi:Sulfotransferase family